MILSSRDPIFYHEATGLVNAIIDADLSRLFSVTVPCEAGASSFKRELPVSAFR